MNSGRHPDAAPDALRTPPVPLVDAARTLGCSRDALRKRLDRGSLRGVKRHGQWYVYLDAADAAVDATRTPPSGQVDAERTPADAIPDTSRELLDELRHHRAQLEEQVADLRQSNSELRRLLALALQQRALPEPRDLETKSAITADLPPRPWWQRWAWWRRGP